MTDRPVCTCRHVVGRPARSSDIDHACPIHMVPTPALKAEADDLLKHEADRAARFVTMTLAGDHAAVVAEIIPLTGAELTALSLQMVDLVIIVHAAWYYQIAGTRSGSDPEGVAAMWRALITEITAARLRSSTAPPTPETDQPR